MSDVDIDAVVLFRPKAPEKLKPFLDLDDDGDGESDKLYAEALEDGSFLVYTFQPFAAFEMSPDAAPVWLEQFGDALPDIHDDPRGLFFFPDSCEPDGNTYDALVAELEDQGIWIAPEDEEPAHDAHDVAGQLAAMGIPGMDMAHLEKIAGQFLGDPSKPQGASSFELGQLFEGMQRQLFDALGVQEPSAHADHDDAHDAPKSPPDDAPASPGVPPAKSSK